MTVVRDIEGTAREDDKNYYSTVVIKFELLSGKGPLDYKAKELIPGLKQIKGLIVYNIGDIEQVKNVMGDIIRGPDYWFRTL